jgi:hypothetical protein
MMVEIIVQGMQEGVFDCTDARWTAELILQLGTLVNDFLAGALFTDQRADRERVASVRRSAGIPRPGRVVHGLSC